MRVRTRITAAFFLGAILMHVLHTTGWGFHDAAYWLSCLVAGVILSFLQVKKEGG